MRKTRVGIGCSTNTDSDGVDTLPLFDDDFCPRSTRQQGGDNVTKTKPDFKIQKKK